MVVKNFSVELSGTVFRFNTLSSKTARAFQVYVMQEGKQLRFHMQINTAGNFYITDPEHCPAYFPLEKELGEAIFQNQTVRS